MSKQQQQDKPAANAGKDTRKGGNTASGDSDVRDDRFTWGPGDIELSGSPDPIMQLYVGKKFSEIPSDLGGSAPARTPAQVVADEQAAKEAGGKSIKASNTPRNRRRAQRPARKARKGAK